MSRYRPVLRIAVPLSIAILLLAAGWSALPAFAQGGAISGTVASPDGYPLPPGTVVKLFDPGEVNLFGQAAPDLNDGTFSLGPVPNGLYLLKAVPPPGSALAQSFPKLVSVVNAPVTGVLLNLTEPQIEGTLLSPDGVTPANGSVRVFAGDGTVLQQVPATGGQFLIGGLPVGGYAVQGLPSGNDPYWHSAPESVAIPALSSSQMLTLTLVAADLWGIVEDEHGVPVPNATVIAARGDGSPQADHSSGSGFWAIGGLVTDTTYTVVAFPPEENAGWLPSTPFTTGIPAAGNPYTLPLGSPPKIIQGQVRTNMGVPIFHAEVVARRVNQAGLVSTLTAPDGTYAMNLSPGLWALTIHKITDTMPVHWVNPSPPQLVFFHFNNDPESHQQDFTMLTADATVIGEVEMPGGGAPPFTVTVGLHNGEGIGNRTEIDPADGSFSLMVPHGGYKVAVHPEDPGYLGPVVDPIPVPPNGIYDLGTLALVAKDALITGTLTDEHGDGVSGIPVVAWRSGTPGSESTHSGPDGQYALAVSGETWHVQPAPGPVHPYLYLGAGELASPPAGGVVPGVDFTLASASATISGSLVDENGNPVSDVDGWAAAHSTSSPGIQNGAPILHGMFNIHVPPGTYNVAAQLPAGSPFMSGGERLVSVGDGEVTSVTLTVLAKDATIAGVLWDPRNDDVVEGVPGVVGAWWGTNWAATHINPGNGAYHLDVAAGIWHLNYRIHPMAGYAKIGGVQNIPVQTGQAVGVPLPVLEKDAAITGTVLAPDGTPLAGAVVLAKGLSGPVSQLWLHTHSDPNGEFRLPVPYGRYRLGAAGGDPTWIKPIEILTNVPPGGASGGHELQFLEPDAEVSGTLTVDNTAAEGDVLVWAWTEVGGFTNGHFPVTQTGGQAAGPYSLGVISGTVWNIGAVFETPSQYWVARASVPVHGAAASQDLVLSGPHPKPAPVVVTFDASQPQRIHLSDGTHIFIPAGAMPATGRITLRIVPVATLPHQHHALLIKYGYAFLATDESGAPIEDHFNQDVVITFAYDESDLTPLGVPEAWLKPAYFSTTTDQWTVPESYVIDTEANRVVMQIDHFTDFALVIGEVETVFLPMLLK